MGYSHLDFTQRCRIYGLWQAGDISKWKSPKRLACTKRHHLFSISHERIYQFLLQDKKKGAKNVG